MGEIATLPEDRERYQQQVGLLEETTVSELTTEARNIETDLKTRFRDWAIPGAKAHAGSAYLDVARTLCRRAERELLLLSMEERPVAIAKYLNRLSDFLWLLARKVERD